MSAWDAAPEDADAPGVMGTEGERENNRAGWDQDTADAAEMAVIGAMLAPPPLDTLRAAVDRLTPEDFSNPRARWLFGVIGRMAVDGILPDMVTVPAYVRQHAIDGPVLLLRHLGSICHEIAGAAPVPASLGFYIDVVKAAVARRKLRAVVRKLAAISIGGDDEDVSRLLAAVDGLVTA